jgi:hypothetical protein
MFGADKFQSFAQGAELRVPARRKQSIEMIE